MWKGKKNKKTLWRRYCFFLWSCQIRTHLWTNIYSQQNLSTTTPNVPPTCTEKCPLAVDHGGWLLTENEPVLMVPKTSWKHSEEKGSNSNSWGASSCVLLVCPCPFNCQSAGSDVSNKSDRGRDGWSRAVALKDWVYTSAFINTSTQELPLVPGNNARSFESQ